MKVGIWKTIGATALSCAVLSGAPAYADLRDDVASELQRRQIEVANLDELHEPQLRQIQAVLRGGEHRAEERDEIQRIATADVPCLANEQMRSQVATGLSQLGIDADLDALSGQEIAELYLVVICDECSQESRVRQVIDQPGRVGADEAQLRTEVGNCLRRMNVQVDVEALTPQQLSEIALVVGSGDSDAEIRDQVRGIAEQ